MLTLTVNGQTQQLDVDAETPLLWALRDHLGLTAAKYSCGIGLCGACSVLVDGAPVASCSVPAGAVVDRAIVTPEGLGGPVVEALREAWVAESTPQCGYCQPGQLVHAAALLERNPEPTDPEIDSALGPVLCRCGSYPAIRRAVHNAAAELAR